MYVSCVANSLRKYHGNRRTGRVKKMAGGGGFSEEALAQLSMEDKEQKRTWKKEKSIRQRAQPMVRGPTTTQRTSRPYVLQGQETESRPGGYRVGQYNWR